MKSILNVILTKNANKLYYRFSNSGGKVWLMPAKNMKVAMNLYQPSGRNGKLLKVLFPCLHKMPLLHRLIHAEKLYCDLNEVLKQQLENLFEKKDLDFAIFCGTPCVHQKITIQLFKEKQIIGYCKITDQENIALLFQEEAKKLKLLEDQNIKGIPHCIHCGKFHDNLYLFVQSTIKTTHSKVLHEWNPMHESFLEELRCKTVQNILFEDSDYCKNLMTFKKHLDWLPQCVNNDFIKNTIDHVIQSRLGKNVEYSVCHADFTPWNMFVEGGRLFVFDWEYAQLTYPPMLDKYHFFTQTARYVKHWTSSQMIEYIKSSDGRWINREIYELYLLDMMSRFTLREGKKVTGNITSDFMFWTNLIEYLQS